MTDTERIDYLEGEVSATHFFDIRDRWVVENRKYSEPQRYKGKTLREALDAAIIDERDFRERWKEKHGTDYR